MDYFALLRSYIAGSGKSLSKISEELSEEGISVSKGYISQLQNGKTGNPGSDEMNRALAKVTGGDPEKLLIAAAIQKSPYEIREKMERLTQLRELRAEYTAVSPDMIEVPVINTSMANINECEYIHKSAAADREVFALKVNNDLMIGDFISTGDVAIAVRTNQVDPSSIAVVSINGQEAILCRIKCQGDICVISYSNSKSQPDIIKSEEVSVIGQLIEVRRKY
ncbi:LexA family protein [Paenibacillus shenyangensis]|uniref:LexA family protein n=1 Tax=Paenibacillus sp. A9 TaxID=1284352 RepID=UPI00036407AD|nr:S24 family peptidase [Paenibacillus sp. A9]